jgi:hypothetical protein
VYDERDRGDPDPRDGLMHHLALPRDEATEKRAELGGQGWVAVSD